MPIFEFVCNECHQPFEELLRNNATVPSVTCPTCGSKQVRKQLSSFASRISGGGTFSANTSPMASCNTGST